MAGQKSTNARYSKERFQLFNLESESYLQILSFYTIVSKKYGIMTFYDGGLDVKDYIQYYDV